MATLFNEVSIILRSISERYPYLVSLLLRKIDENDDEIIDVSHSYYYYYYHSRV